MGLHASYYPISPNTLNNFIAGVHSKDFWKAIYAFREESKWREFAGPPGFLQQSHSQQDGSPDWHWLSGFVVPETMKIGAPCTVGCTTCGRLYNQAGG